MYCKISNLRGWEIGRARPPGGSVYPILGTVYFTQIVNQNITLNKTGYVIFTQLKL